VEVKEITNKETVMKKVKVYPDKPVSLKTLMLFYMSRYKTLNEVRVNMGLDPIPPRITK